MDVDPKALRAWIGRSDSATDTITATPIRALDATLDRPARLVESRMPLPPS